MLHFLATGAGGEELEVRGWAVRSALLGAAAQLPCTGWYQCPLHVLPSVQGSIKQPPSVAGNLSP